MTLTIFPVRVFSVQSKEENEFKCHVIKIVQIVGKENEAQMELLFLLIVGLS